jgi:hypothetical protein
MVEVDRGIMARDSYVARPQEETIATMEAGSVGEAVAGAAGLVLAILGLLGILPLTLDAIAGIALGVALLLGGAALAARYSRAIPPTALPRARHDISGALGLQAIAGIAAVVLGVLALLGVSSLELLAVTVIVLGAALLAVGGGMARLGRSARWLRADAGRSGEVDSASVAAGWEALIGVAAVVLGILALTGRSPLMLTLIAMLCVGAALLVTGSLVASRLFSFFG